MFEHLREYDQILVTGPHRAGTTIAAEMIARDTTHECLREEVFDFYNEAALAHLLATRHAIVVQCPALFVLMPKLSTPAMAIVMMHRPLDQLRFSRNRMFHHKGKQLKADVQNARQLELLGEKTGDAAAFKYERWTRWTSEGLIHNPVDVEYDALEQHPMWVPPRERRKLGRKWHFRRTEL